MARDKYPKPVKGQVLNRSQAAAFFGVAPTTVDQWIRAGCPYIAQAKVGISSWEFDSAALIEWHLERLLSEQSSKAGENAQQASLDEAKRRKLEAEAAMAEINLQKMQGKLVDFQDVMRAGMQSYADCKAVLLNIPPRLASKILTCDTPEQSRAMLELEVFKALKALADYEPDSHERDANQPDPGVAQHPAPPGQDDGQPVGG